MFVRRLIILLCLLLLAGAVLIARLAQIQIGWHDRFDREAYTRTGGSHLVESARGGIYARWGTPLAVQVPSFDVGVHYAALTEVGWREPVSKLCGVPPGQLAEAAERIVRRVERMEEHINARRRAQGRPEIQVAERLAYHRVLEDVLVEVAAALRTEPELFPPVEGGRGELRAVRLLESSRRRYPNGGLAPHVVGRVALLSAETWEGLAQADRTWTMGEPFSRIGSRYKMDDRLGALGAEKAFEGLLRGQRGYVLNQLVFGLLAYRKESAETAPEAGLDVYLTIREDFQAAANEALRRAAEEEQYAHLEFASGALVIVDVRDGAVLAAATYPSYDLATFRERYEQIASDPRSPLLFRPLQAALPTGSVYKVITATAALEEDEITPSTIFTCRRGDTFRAGRSERWFECTGRHGAIDLLPAIERSCNTYFYNAGLKAGREALARWGRAFGLGVPTGVDLPYARAGQLPEPRHTYGVINLSIGQGLLLCTPLQVANMMGAIANGGRLYAPHFFDHARSAEGDVVRRHEPEFVRIDVSPETLRLVREGMRRVVEGRHGTARRAGLKRFGVAGKTGTAELGRGQPFHAWFAGFAPHDDPRIAFAVVSERTPGHGGSHAAPIMALCLEQIWDAAQ
ncbi:MAG: peptidoglycan D,D-transpeptidase FtsI family protein [Planctomycetota bacterium]